jgi:hypothetical protein
MKRDEKDYKNNEGRRGKSLRFSPLYLKWGVGNI